MDEKHVGRKSVYVILSILMATLFWFYVRQVEDPEQSRVIRDVPVVLSGENILENQGLTIASISNTTVDLTVRTNVSVLNQLNRSNISVEVDVSKYASTGIFSANYTILLPTTMNTSGVIIEVRDPKQIEISVEKLYVETFPIEFILRGSIAEDYQAGQPTINPETVNVTGAVEQIAQIDRIAVILEREALSARFSGDLPLIMLDSKGNELQDLDVKLSTESAYVTLPIVVLKEIPLTVSFTNGGGATEADVSYITISPETIVISGAEDDVLMLNEISLGNIDLSKIVGTGTMTFPINLDPSLNNVSGITEAKVTVVLEGLDTKAFDVTNIELLHVPDGYIATAETQLRTVVVRGSADVLETIDPSQLRIAVDLSNISAVGSISVPAKVYLDATQEAGVIGSYSIIVNISGRP